jgi:HEAT repeat protein
MEGSVTVIPLPNAGPASKGMIVIRLPPSLVLFVVTSLVVGAGVPSPADDGQAEALEQAEAIEQAEERSPGEGRPSQQAFMLERGFVRYRGAWRTSQEIELIERSERDGVARKQWAPRLEKLRRRLDDPSTAATAAEELREIVDPAAVPALGAALAREGVPQVRAFLIEALARIGTGDALAILVQVAIDHADPDTRLTAVERIGAIGPRVAEPALVAALAGPDNARVNRAAEAIGALGLSTAAAALVDALETEHTVIASDGRQAGQTSVAFGSTGGDGLSLGGGPKRGKVRLRNEAALAALVRITGEDHQWNLPAWRQMLAARELAEPIDLRRGR